MLRDDLYTLIEPTVESLGFELWGLQLITGGQRHVLRIFIENEKGVNIDDCAAVSRQVGSVLDVEDPISNDYVLEVSSPGVDRYLFKKEQYDAYIGAKIKVKLSGAQSGRRNYSGQLIGIEDNDVVVRVDNEEYLLPFESIERAQVFFN